MSAPRRQQHILYHGTSAETAELIKRDGFKPSTSGCLGPGVYVARADKASNFAANNARHGGASGAVLKLRITFWKAKYVRSDDVSWQSQGFDACRADKTTRSDKPEWCLRSPSQVEVLDVRLITPSDRLPAFEGEVLSLPTVRNAAVADGLQEVYHKMEDGVVSFAEDAAAADSPRIDVYYSTGTAVVRPKKGSNRRYVLRGVDSISLQDAYREVAGGDSHQSAKRSRPSSSKAVNRHGPAEPEEVAVSAVLAVLRHEAAEAKRRVHVAEAVLNDHETRREEVKRRETEAKRLERQAAAAVLAEQQRQMAAAARGTSHTCWLTKHQRETMDESFDGASTVCVSINDAGVFIVNGDGGWQHYNMPSELHDLMEAEQKKKATKQRTPKYVALGTNDRYYIEFTDGTSQWYGDGQSFSDAVGKEGREGVRTVAFGAPGSWFIVYNDGGWEYVGIPVGLEEKIDARRSAGDLECVSLGPDGEWFLKAQNGRLWWEGVPSMTIEIDGIADRITFMDFASDDKWIVRYT